MPAEVYLAGTRTFAAEVIDVARDSGFSVCGLLEPSERSLVGTRIHDQDVAWLDDGPQASCDQVAVATGDADRGQVVQRLEQAGWRPVSLVHPTAHVAPTATLGRGVLVGAGAVVGAQSAIGDHVVLNRGALVGHHTRVGRLATLGPGANVAGNVRLGAGAFVGMGAMVRDHLTVGDRAVVAMGSVVLRDVPAEARVQGVPAVQVRLGQTAH